MTSVVTAPQTAEVFYPSSDGEPLAATSVHVDAMINAVVALRQYLAGQQAIALADQFLYYAQGYPKLRVAPDVIVILNVPPGPRDNRKFWPVRRSSGNWSKNDSGQSRNVNGQNRQKRKQHACENG
jgi:hypothetical protein